MDSNQWEKVLNISELKDNVLKAVSLEDEDILLLKQRDKIYAYGGKCPHYGAPLEKGHLSGHELTCPWHNARFNLKNGMLISPPALDNLPEYEVRVDGQDVLIRKKQAQDIPKPDKIDESTTYLIIGGGAAGNSAAETLRREGFSGKIIMLTPEEDLPYDRTILSKAYMSNTAEDDWVPLRAEKFYKDHGIEVKTGVKIKDLIISESIALAEDGKEYKFDKCLLATGGIPKNLNVDGADKENVFLLRSFQDARKISEAVENAENITVIGSGFIGLEVAASLREREKQVTVVTLEKVPMAKALGDEIGRYIQKMHEDNGVKFQLEKSVSELRGGNSVEEIVFTDGDSIKTDLVIIGIGIEPAVDYLKNTNLVENGAVKVNANFQTNADSIYAAGDIAAYPDPASGKPNRIEHWVVAQRQGSYAAKAMVGKNNIPKEAPFFWTRQFGNSIKYIGHVGAFDQVVCRSKVEEGKFLCGYFYKGNLRAAATLGMGDDLYAVEKLLEAGKSVEIEQFRNEEFDIKSLL